MTKNLLIIGILIAVTVAAILAGFRLLSPNPLREFSVNVGDSQQLGILDVRVFRDSRAIHGPTLFVFAVPNKTAITQIVSLHSLSQIEALDKYVDEENTVFNFKETYLDYFQKTYPNEIIIDYQNSVNYAKTGRDGLEPQFMVLVYNSETEKAYLLDGWSMD